MGADFLTDETSRLPVLGHPCARQHRHPGKHGEVARQRQHHALGQWCDWQAQRVAVQPGQAWEVAQVPAKAVCNQWQHQRVKPDKGPGGQAREHASAVGLLPIQGADHRGRELGNSREGNLPDGRKAGG